jgi:hypothetical protein
MEPATAKDDYRAGTHGDCRSRTTRSVELHGADDLRTCSMKAPTHELGLGRDRSRSAGRTHRVLTAADSSQRPDQPHLPHRVGELSWVPRSGPCPSRARMGARAPTSFSPPRRSVRRSPPTSTRPPRTSCRCATAVRRRRVRRRAVGPAGVEDTAVLVPARHGGQGDPAGASAVHGRARERDDRGGTGLPRLVRFAARRRDPAHPSGRRGDHAND